jgi:opacity protein-like surface antigen
MHRFIRERRFYRDMRNMVLAAVAAIAFLSPVAASAQEVPSYAQPVNQDHQIRGRVTAFDGHYGLTVRDDRGYIDNIRLHQGTVINPTGLTLAAGMVVSVVGYNAGSYFAANVIDTPYTYVYGIPYYYGHPWYYYGPSVSLGFFFGGPWHGYWR